MPTAKSAMSDVEERVVEFVRLMEESAVDAGKAFADTWSEALGHWAPSDGARIAEMVDGAFDFAVKIIETQREFAKSVVETVTASIEGLPRRAPARARARKPAGTRAPARKPAARKPAARKPAATAP